MNIRTLAAQILAPILSHKGSLNTHLTKNLTYCPEQDKALLKQICTGTMRDLPQLELLAQKLLKHPFKASENIVYALTLIGLHQLRSLRVAEHAAINETVDAAHELNKNWATKVINAVLRNYQRRQEHLEEWLKESQVGQYNHPNWFIEKLQHNWPEHWQQILEGNNSEAPLTLRVNQQKISRDEFLKELEAEDFEAEVTAFSKAGIRLLKNHNPAYLPGYKQGWFSVQDEAAQLAGYLLDLKPQHKVLDACTAPGGKLCHILELEADLTQVDAIELEAHRAERIEENLDRLELDAEVKIADASKSDWWEGEPYDRILLDAPCSATGVIRRHPDIKYLKQGEDIAKHAEVQLQMLENIWPMLAENGILLYATCSIFPQENERLIKRFLAMQADAESKPITADWGLERPYGRQLFPTDQGPDGFYYAVLYKNKMSQ